MKVVHVVPAVAEEASGPSYSVPNLCESLLRQGDDVTLAALAWSQRDRALPYLRTFPMSRLWPRRLGASRGLNRWLRAGACGGEIDVLHNHGMWQMNSLYPGWAARRSGGRCRLVVSPRGALSEWALRHGSRTKKLVWPLAQRSALAAATCFHATAESECEDIRRLGFRQPVAIIPNGIDLPEAAAEPRRGAPRTLLFLGRIHQKKGLDLLLPAWAQLEPAFADWRLLIAGDDAGYAAPSGYLAEMRELAATLGLRRVEFVGELLGDAKRDAYRDAELFVLPTHSENFGMSVAEALASATPAVVTEGAPWSGLREHGAGWWCDISRAGLTAALRDAMTRPAGELAAMGQRGRQWMEDDFAWDHIGERMAETYRWICGQVAQRPGWIVTD